MSTLKPPQAPPSWTHTPAQVLELTKELIEKDQNILDNIGALAPKDCTFKSVFLTLAESETYFDSISEPLSFYQNVSPSKEVRDASNNAESLVRDFRIESSMRLDVFQAKVAAEKNIKASGEWEKLSAEEKRLVEKMLLDGKRAGLALPEKERTELTTLKKELSQVCLEFSKNSREENGFISFTAEELDGVPKDIISGYTKRTEDSKELYDVTYKMPDIFPVFKFAVNPTTRQRAYEGHESRLAINVPLLAKALALRRKIASLLGYETWADYVTEPKMIKNAKGAMDFLNELETKLRPVGIRDRSAFVELKKAEQANIIYQPSEPFNDPSELYIWDYRYYERKFIESSLDLDESLIKEYFPVSVVVPKILEIYQNLLGVKFETFNEGEAWHPDVQKYTVWEKDAKDESGFVGYCYLDLFPREAKFSRAAMWPLLAGYEINGGKRSYPVTAMVANLAKSTPDKPALMRHRDVITFFHEMGHAFHGLLSKTKFARFHGTSVARDFVEAPSQMLENWCWEPKVLQKMSNHYETGKPLSDALIEKLVKSRYINVGLMYLRQTFLAKFDMKVHTDQDDSPDYTKLWNELRDSIWLVKSGKQCPGQGAFSHIAGGYDAGYYGYSYSVVFAADMYATVFKADPLDPARGKLYRDKILKYGSSRDEIDSMTDFLGRPPDTNAFLNEIFKDV